MASHRVRRRVNRTCSDGSPGRAGGGQADQSVQWRRARVTVQYNRRELQRRLEVERWIDRGLDLLYRGREDEMPEGVNIDELLDLKTDEERTQRLQDVFHSCNNNTEVFICELLLKLDGLQKQDDLHDGGINISPAHSGSADTEALR